MKTLDDFVQKINEGLNVKGGKWDNTDGGKMDHEAGGLLKGLNANHNNALDRHIGAGKHFGELANSKVKTAKEAHSIITANHPNMSSDDINKKLDAHFNAWKK